MCGQSSNHPKKLEARRRSILGRQMAYDSHPTTFDRRQKQRIDDRDRRSGEIRMLKAKSNLSWCIIGDLNNVTSQSDKREGNSYPNWLIDGFCETLTKCELVDMDLFGYPFTWERGRGSSEWVEVRIDRALVSQTWLHLFPSGKLWNLEATTSDHSPLNLVLSHSAGAVKVRVFRFENSWLKEPLCFKIIEDVWSSNSGSHVSDKIKFCSDALLIWGKDYFGNFQERLNKCKTEMKKWKRGRDPLAVQQFKAAELEFNNVLLQKELFTPGLVEVQEVVGTVSGVVSQAQNTMLLEPISDEEIRRALFQMHPDKSPGPDGYFPPSLNETNIVLIPKKKNAEFMTDLRDISLCNVLYKVISKDYERRHRISGIRVARGAPIVSNMLFTDDSYVYCKANVEEASSILQMLQFMLHMTEASDNSFYLGLPCIMGRKKNAILGFLKEKMKKKIFNWESQFLSKAGKEVLIRSVAQALPSYAMSVFLLTKEICAELEGLMAKFWWKSQSNSSSKGVSWMSWRRLTKHKHVGGLGFRDLRGYNLSFLAKQGWRLLTNESSLVSRMYKARYYPNGSFLTAALGQNPSFIWRSIFEAQDVVKQGARRSIGSGQTVSILNDPWLPDSTNPYVQFTHPALVDQHVDSLMCMEGHSWDLEVVLEYGNFRSFLRENWFMGVLETQSIEVGVNAAMVSWSIWNARNDVLWKQKKCTAAGVLYSARTVLQQWSAAHAQKLGPLLVFGSSSGVEQLQKPVSHYIKVNVDGGIFAAEHKYGFGCVARDANGRLIEGISGSRLGNVGPEIAEVIGVKEALSWIKRNGWTEVEIESDALVVVQAVLGSVLMPSQFGYLVQDCRSLLSSLNSVSLNFVKRSANRAAHCVARASCLSPNRIFNEHNAPSELLAIVDAECY
uniref:RNase H type-1 domain-containing protein n=1 Tax=Cannabis sativa TaxID=3483 RepID=A0A803PNG6_CANSA